MFVEKLLESGDILLRLLDGTWWYWVPRHGDAEIVTCRVLPVRVSMAVKPGSESMVRTTPGKIFFILSAAHAALGFPPSRQSSNSNNGWRTGFENDTRAESTNVMVRTPHP